MRDWRSGIVTVTVRDQRNREHDPILGVIPLKISEILETSTQVTRWYPLDGGIVSTGTYIIRRLWLTGHRDSAEFGYLYFSAALKHVYHQIFSAGMSVHLSLSLIR